MEDFVKVVILNEQRLLTKEDFIKINCLLQVKHINELKSVAICLDEESMRVLHIFTYYIIKVNKKFQIPNLQQIYQRQLNPFYIKRKLKINILQFACICGKILSLKLQECFHIIYYLIYGRLATSSYVEAISKSQGYLQRKEKMKINSSMKNFRFKQSSNWQKKQEFLQNLSPVQQLKQQLKQILKPSKSEKKIKKTQKIIEDTEDYQDHQDHNAKIIQTSNSKYFNIFFPNRVQKNQKSAILEVGQKKGKFLRKRRFNEHYISKINKTKIENVEQTQKLVAQACSVFVEKQKKLNINNFSKVIEQIRSSSHNLDKMRSQIEDNKKKLKKKGNQKYVNNFILSQNNHLQNQNAQENENDYFIKHSQRYEIDQDDAQNENKFQSILQKNTCIKNAKQDSFGSAMTLISFGKKQNKLFKFKSEYRKFLKNQLFQHQDD